MKIMAVDFGEARTGLAVCDRTEFLASPVGVIQERDFETCVKKVAYAAVKELDVGMVVVGLPKNMDGSLGPRAELCDKFARALRALIPLPVETWDERQTTMQAATYLNEMNVRGAKRKEVIDEVAATIILESYLQYRRNQRSKEKE
ncbi:Putative Holliday junction resolvase [uncultured Ruminococcus sp.]|uniref:Putative pre-16S rRNA nuclease n=1 Tax=Massiliimalia timonensis TaxID=1987501 RepID=A0A8J6PE32_9FIRM|nr:Holliday junction resolvase RuvX [Massiliimalia timonensis]MBC8611348.1 Holliday junction resolvase RuvX [Massiliimalia timonensis]MBS7175137.1 Holliday junction resolvase RuvX [Clostridiales bacterium]SCH07871.1 Putative Holliday junction resolvase [uncultured Clostridium sp.]SCI03973.1 Putative Holliday junction resolvase [uncultured Ruminococcus sp.]